MKMIRVHPRNKNTMLVPHWINPEHILVVKGAPEGCDVLFINGMEMSVLETPAQLGCLQDILEN